MKCTFIKSHSIISNIVISKSLAEKGIEKESRLIRKQRDASNLSLEKSNNYWNKNLGQSMQC